MVPAIELGLLYAVVALGVYLTFRVLNFPDLTVDGSFTTGAAVVAVLLTKEVNPILAMAAACTAGMVAGAITGLLHTKLKIDGLLAGILTMIALWSINLRIMGIAIDQPSTPNVGVRSSESLFSVLRRADLLGTWGSVAILFAGVVVIKLVIDCFLATDRGLAVQATGNNEKMISSFCLNTDNQKILGLALSNGLVALGGALVAQYQGGADISMGIGLILIGLASVILGQAFFGNSRVWLGTFGVIVGAVLYRLIIFWAIAAGLSNTDVRLITAVIVVIALVIPRLGIVRRMRVAVPWRNREPVAGQPQDAGAANAKDATVTGAK